MKIYFEDDQLVSTIRLPVSPNYVIDAKMGYTNCEQMLEDIKDNQPSAVVYTNHIGAFSNKWAWNEELAVPEIYIRAGEHMIFTRIDKLTSRELREGHNLTKMYISGEFDTCNDVDFDELRLSAIKILNKHDYMNYNTFFAEFGKANPNAYGGILYTTIEDLIDEGILKKTIENPYTFIELSSNFREVI